MRLEGIRVIDFSMLLPGPYATLRLADLGAEIVKVEPPNGGDPARHANPKVAGTGAVFLANNRNKQSVVLDLKTESGRNDALALIERADVVVEGFRPGVMRKLGLDYETVHGRNKGLVYCSLTGYGQTGPLSNMAGHDVNYLAVSGVLSQLRGADGRPVMPTVQLGDMVGGIAASEAILAALVERDRTGEGSYLDVSMTEVLAGMLTNHAVVQQTTGYDYGIRELNGELVCYHLYATADGRTVSLGALEPKFWRNFCDAVGRAEWTDNQFSAATDGMSVYEEVKALFRSRTLSEWAEFGRLVDCCLQPVQTVTEFLNSDYASERGVNLSMPSPAGIVLEQVNTSAGGCTSNVKRPVATYPSQFKPEDGVV